jgi:hypothetical protein
VTSFLLLFSVLAVAQSPQVVGTSPAYYAAGVPTNAFVQIQFNKRIDPLTVTNATFQVLSVKHGNPGSGDERGVHRRADGDIDAQCTAGPFSFLRYPGH